MVYVYQPTNPLQSFADGFQAVTGMQDRRAVLQQEAMQQEQAQMAKASFVRDLQAWRENPTREAWAELQVMHPEMAKAAKPLADLYNEQGVSAITNLGANFLGTPAENRAALLERAVEAANNSRMPDVAKLFSEALEVQKVDPDRAEAMVRAVLVQNAPDVYDKVFKRGQEVQNYMDFAEMLGPQKAEEIVGVTPRDGIQVLPNGMVIAGPDSPLARSLGGGAAPNLPTVSTKEQVEALAPGTAFIWGPSGRQMTKQGGTSGNAGGSFPRP